MSSSRNPATDPNTRSTEELTADLAAEYGAHLGIMDRRLEEALKAAGFDGAVIFAGDEKTVFRDDQSYPFNAEPYFKAWLPLGDAPGSFLRLVPGQRPMLVYKQLEDYWYEPPSDPSGYWTPFFDIRIARSDAEARKLAGAGPRWVAVGENAAEASGGATGPAPAINDLLPRAPRLPARDEDALRSRVHARGASDRRARPRGGRRGVRQRRVGARAAPASSRG